MSTISILTKDEKIAYEHPPILTPEARALCFAITPEAEIKIKRLRTDVNKIGFLLQYGYFKVCKRFFTVNRFRREDLEYVASTLELKFNKIDFKQYKKKMPITHQQAILELFGYKSLDQDSVLWLEDALQRDVKRLVEPRKLFFTVLNLLHDRKIALPSYHLLSELISKHYLAHEEDLLKIIRVYSTPEQENRLSELLTINENSHQMKLTQFKVINQSLNPKAIQASVALFEQLANVFNIVFPIAQALELTPESCGYYATWVKKAKISQLKQFPYKDRLFLHLTAFCQHQFYLRQDAFIDIMIKSVQSMRNTANARLNKSEQLSRKEKRDAIRHITDKNHQYKELIDEITEITKSVVLTDSGKVNAIATLLARHEQAATEKETAKIELFEKSLDRIVNDSDYFDTIEGLSLKLQNKVSGILKVLSFDENNSDKAIMEAISYFKTKDGKLDHNAPMDFLSPSEKDAVVKDNKYRISLYKSLLFMHICDAIKSGELNLKHSYRYKSIDDYLIDKNTWKINREKLLADAGLAHFADYNAVLSQIEPLLDHKYEQINTRFHDQLNPYLLFNKEGRFHVTTPALDDKQTEHIATLLSQSGHVQISKILSDVNKITEFSRCFTHHNIKNATRYSNPEICIAGIIGLGCNIGIPKMGMISSGVNPNTLRNTVNWFFSQKTLEEANKQIIFLINKLSLPNVFIADMQNKHSSSDGRKVNVAVESLLANFSFKYFGKDKGVSVYTFIDERQILFYSTVISASEREAAYVIDGLNNNDVIKTHIHSTDTHGYTELIFAATHFMGCTFAPRIKNIGEQNIYSFSNKKTYDKKGYKILPDQRINKNLIIENWDNILRFMATIKLKHTPASQLFKRLSSYTHKNPLYKAIKEFGRVIKSLFILTYLDDMKLRQRIEKQLNRIELSNKFSKAVFYANNSEFTQADPEGQQLAVACKIMIQNSIVLWNYLYLSQILSNCRSDEERLEIIELIKEGSVITWRHVNLHGEFDFRPQAANDSFFNMDKILSLKLA